MQTKTIAKEEALNVWCKYLDECPDVRRLLGMRDNEKSTITYLNLADQYHELCLSASPESCSIYKNLERDYRMRFKDIGIGI